MKNSVQPAKVITIAADRVYDSGDLTRIGNIVGVVASWDTAQAGQTQAAVGDELELVLEGGHTVAADPALVASVGDRIAIDVANKQVVAAGGGGGDIGIVIWKDKIAGDPTVNIRLDGVSLA